VHRHAPALALPHPPPGGSIRAMTALRDQARDLAPTLVSWRRHLHRHPELSYEEVETAAFVRERLAGLGLEPSPPMAGGTGLTCLVRGEADGPTVALRADMDALPIQEESEAPYASAKPGVAHLCGHDAHTAMLLGAAALLARRRPPRGHVQLLFQPAEEGGAGAARMIEDGALDAVEAIFALHVDPRLPAGSTGVSVGPVHAAADSVDIEIIGSGGHAAYPHLSVDAVTVAAQVVSALQHVVSRYRDPLAPLVLTLGTIRGGFARNVIAPTVTMQGTVRSFDAALRARVPELVERTVPGVAAAHGATARVAYTFGYPATVNAEALVPTFEASAAAVMGEGQHQRLAPTMGAEDFSYYAQRVPGLIARLGVRNEGRGVVHPLHHPRFDLDEDALPLGAALLADVATRWLAERG
jgi:amidohydrolase